MKRTFTLQMTDKPEHLRSLAQTLNCRSRIDPGAYIAVRSTTCTPDGVAIPEVCTSDVGVPCTVASVARLEQLTFLSEQVRLLVRQHLMDVGTPVRLVPP